MPKFWGAIFVWLVASASPTALNAAIGATIEEEECGRGYDGANTDIDTCAIKYGIAHEHVHTHTHRNR